MHLGRAVWSGLLLVAACGFDGAGLDRFGSGAADGDVLGIADAPAPVADAPSGTPDGPPAPPDAPQVPPDAQPAVDAEPYAGVECGGMTCATSCCRLNNLTYVCDSPTCLGDLYECDGPEDCSGGQRCCSDGNDTRCVSGGGGGSCPEEVCHLGTGTCTCELSADHPYPICD